MDAYDPSMAPRAFGLNNTGVICYMNSFLQMLAGCTSLARTVLQHSDYLAQTRTGSEVVAFFRAITTLEGAKAPDAGIEFFSARIVLALAADLKERRPWVSFGSSQESASEVLVHLLDMMQPAAKPETPEAKGAREALLPLQSAPLEYGPDAILAVESLESPVTRLFLHRFRCDLLCRECHQCVSRQTDYSVVFNLFHIDRLKAKPSTPADFSNAVRRQVSLTEDFKCPECHRRRKEDAAARGEDPAKIVATATTAYRVYNLTMVPEIIICCFNLYVEYGGRRNARYFPDRLELLAVDGGMLVFCLVGQVEHAGSLHGGHYWARGLRAEARAYLLNDTGVSPTTFGQTTGTYMIAYHYVGHQPAPDPLATLADRVSSVSLGPAPGNGNGNGNGNSNRNGDNNNAS